MYVNKRYVQRWLTTEGSQRDVCGISLAFTDLLRKHWKHDLKKKKKELDKQVPKENEP